METSGPTMNENSHMIIYRYNGQGKANPVVRRKSFERLSLEELNNMHLPFYPFQLQEEVQELAYPQQKFKRLSNQNLFFFKNPLIKPIQSFPFVDRAANKNNHKKLEKK